VKDERESCFSLPAKKGGGEEKEQGTGQVEEANDWASIESAAVSWPSPRNANIWNAHDEMSRPNGQVQQCRARKKKKKRTTTTTQRHNKTRADRTVHVDLTVKIMSERCLLLLLLLLL
jgi:hypothetical protein